MSQPRLTANIAGAATYVVNAVAGRLWGLVVNKAVANGVITIYDNTAASGKKIATITHPATLLNSQISLDFQGAQFGIGLTVVTSAADDITVIYS